MGVVLIHKESLGDDGPALIDDRSQFLIAVWKQFLQSLLFQQVFINAAGKPFEILFPESLWFPGIRRGYNLRDLRNIRIIGEEF